MKSVGIRKLKAQLSRVVREVRDGEVVLVTDRGRVVAEMRSPGTPGEAGSEIDRRLRRLAAEGGLHLGAPHDASAYARSGVRVRKGTGRALLDAERGER